LSAVAPTIFEGSHVLYDVTTITIRPGTQGKALAKLEGSVLALAGGSPLLACWFSDIGALNRILVIQAHGVDPIPDHRRSVLESSNPFGVGDLVAGLEMDTYVSFPFVEAMAPGARGPVFEVRTYLLKPDGLGRTMDLWRKAVPARIGLSPLLAAMYSITGPVTRFMHIWPYASIEERGRLRAQAIADGVWPPPGGPDHLATQQSDIYLAAPFSPIR
jgi:hypothetical protein